MLCITFAMLFLIITFGIYDYNKKRRRDREEEENIIEIPNSRAQVVPLEVLSLDKCPNINEEISIERNPIILPKKANSFSEWNVEDFPLPKPRKTLYNTIQANNPDAEEHIENLNRNDQSESPVNKNDEMTLWVTNKDIRNLTTVNEYMENLKRNDEFEFPIKKDQTTMTLGVKKKEVGCCTTDVEGYIENLNRNDQSESPIYEDADTQTTMSLGVKKNEDLRTKGCWTTTLITVAVIHTYIHLYIYIYILYIYIYIGMPWINKTIYGGGRRNTKKRQISNTLC